MRPRFSAALVTSKCGLAEIVGVSIRGLYPFSAPYFARRQNVTKLSHRVQIQEGGFNFRTTTVTAMATSATVTADATRCRTYQAEKFLSFRRTHLLQIDGNDGSNSGLDEFFALAHALALYTRIYIYCTRNTLSAENGLLTRLYDSILRVTRNIIPRYKEPVMTRHVYAIAAVKA